MNIIKFFYIYFVGTTFDNNYKMKKYCQDYQHNLTSLLKKKRKTLLSLYHNSIKFNNLI